MALPSGYTQLSYIESTGTQYIDLNLNWSLYHAIVVDGEILSFDDTVRLVGILDGQGSYNLMYSMGAWRSSDFGDNFILSVGLGNTAPAAFTSSYSSGRHVWSAALTPGTGVGTMTFKIDGLTVDSGEYFSGTTGSNVSYYLFGSHLVNSSQSILWQSGNMRIYEAKITNVQTGTVLRHLYPAKRDADGVLGMYDTANDQFYTNAGTGTFVEGPSPTGTYTVTVTSGGNGTATASPASGVTGTEVTLTATPNTGYELSRWEVLSGGVTITANKFTIGTADVSIRAVFAPIAPTTYTVTMSTDGHGTATATPSSGSTGTEVVLQATPNSGYRFLSWTVLSGGVTINNNRFTLGTADVSIRANFEEHVAPAPITYYQQLQTYLKNLVKPFKKVVRLEFLQPDDTVAFALGGAGQKFRIPGRDTRTFLQSGSVSVNLANGSRRKASVVLANRDGSFDYAVNKLWFGQRLRISMGMRLPDGEDFYFPMGVFYVENPSALFSPGERTTTLNLTDKWAYLDGSLFGNLEAAYSVDAGTNIYSAIDSLLRMNKYTGNAATDVQNMIDPTPAAYTPYFNGKTYYANRSDGSISSNIAMTDTPYTITENRGSTMGALILKLNEMLAGWIGYDATGTLRLEPSEDDVDDADKPVLFAFTPENSILLSHSSVAQNTAVYNDVTVAGQGLTGSTVWARAVNADPASDTNINLIGRRVYVEEKSDYWNTDQCASLAKWMLKRKTILRKSVTIECGQMFHLVENRLISVKRTDKPGSPVEKHLIQGFTIPIGETGSMSITATSVTDIPDYTITTSYSG